MGSRSNEFGGLGLGIPIIDVEIEFFVVSLGLPKGVEKGGSPVADEIESAVFTQG